MKTLQIASYGEPIEVVEVAELQPRDPGPRDVVVKLEAAPINPSDLMLIRGFYGVHPELPAALGAEGVGRIVAVGEDVDGSRLGERVVILPTLEQTTWREETVLNERNAIAVDPDADALQLAMLGINPITAYAMLHGYANLEAGAWVAQTGASSATGRYINALAKQAGLRTLNVVRRQESAQALLDASADSVLVSGEDLDKQAAEVLGGAPIELILDAVGGETTRQLASLTEPGAAIVSYAALDRTHVLVSPGDLIYRGLSIHGFWLLNWLRDTPGPTIAQTYSELAALVAAGTLSAPVAATYTLEEYEAAIAHATKDGDGRNGKVLFRFS